MSLGAPRASAPDDRFLQEILSVEDTLRWIDPSTVSPRVIAAPPRGWSAWRSIIALATLLVAGGALLGHQAL